MLADLCGALSEKDSVFYYFDKAIQVSGNDKDFELIVKVNKGNYLFNQFDFEGALNIYDEVLAICQESNDEKTYNYILIKKASILFELEKYDEALVIYKENLKKDLNEVRLLDVKLGLVKSYIKLKQPDSAYIYINKSIKECRENNLKEHEIHFLKQLGLYYIDKGKLGEAEKVMQNALQIAEVTENINVIAPIQIDISKIFTLKKDYNPAITTLLKMIDSKDVGLMPIEYLSEMYYLTAENYKFLGNTEKSNYYFQLFIDKSKKIGQKKIDTIDHLHKIDISELQNREASLINQKWGLFLIVLILFVVVFVVYINKRGIEKQNQLKFDELLFKIRNYEEETKNIQLSSVNEPIIGSLIETEDLYEDTIQEDAEVEAFAEEISNENEFLDDSESELNYEEPDTGDTEVQNSNSGFNIKDETVADILEKLIKLEEKKQFLRQDFTLHYVAKKLKTNTAYLSKIINSELGKSFSTYANELRINYIILELKNNAKLRSYSISAIAEEIGYKSPESFTKYFKAATGISPSVYIKKINEIN
ncbi:helix-turn-helix domain-containing protein [Flavobacterium amniphilum]|uniref:helix-turn-helix domain-containing protein n=1 Tax=Flavobacterium amniphilum TaxID=1834035 RepID=UPI00202A4720|nr:helix-turn-helix domain-containing protein [Flavobacterium amniphilum]MCL9807401.1 helix-turn-helix domain-containing protein [Flavobacterium amniphilum]